MGIADQFRDKAQRLAEQAKSKMADPHNGDDANDGNGAGTDDRVRPGERRARDRREDYDDSYEA
jgi:hypothetical protein